MDKEYIIESIESLVEAFGESIFEVIKNITSEYSSDHNIKIRSFLTLIVVAAEKELHTSGHLRSEYVSSSLFCSGVEDCLKMIIDTPLEDMPLELHEDSPFKSLAKLRLRIGK
jgi:hypothetical protein